MLSSWFLNRGANMKQHSRKVASDLRALTALAHELAGGIRYATRSFTHMETRIMADIQALTDKISELAGDITAYEAREQAIVDALQAHVTDLQAQVDANVPVDTTALIAQVQGIIDAIPATPADPDA